MTKIDLFSIALLVAGLSLGILLFFVMKQNKPLTNKWPRAFGLGAAIFLFVSLILARMLFFPTTDFFSHLTDSLLLSLVIGIVAWFGAAVNGWLKK